MSNAHRSDFGDAYTVEHPAADEIRNIESEIRRHPGRKLQRQLDDVTRILGAWAGFSNALMSLVHECETEQRLIHEIMRNIGNQDGRRAVTIALDQSMIAYVAGLGAVVEHTRNAVRNQSDRVQASHQGRVAALNAELPAAAFLVKLRNYVLHHVALPWEFRGELLQEGATAEVLLNTPELLRHEWAKPARDFLLTCGDQLRLGLLLRPFHDAITEVTSLALSDCWDSNPAPIDELNKLIARRNLLLTGGVTDGRDWQERMAHAQENLVRMQSGEPQVDFETGLPFDTTDDDPS